MATFSATATAPRLSRAARASSSSPAWAAWAAWAAALWPALAAALGCTSQGGLASSPEPAQSDAQALSPFVARPLPYSTEPGWRSRHDEDVYSMGLGLADIDGDGFKDIVVANGNDMTKQPIVVYSNDGTGHFPPEPSWSSADADHNTGLAVGDIDRDGWVDVAVSVGPREPGTVGLGHVKVYRNRGGALEPTPGYRSADGYSSVGCALGDADGDGDLDLAASVALEEGYAPGPARIYENVGGALSPLPSWKSARVDHSFGMEFADIDEDGLLDLAVAMPGVPIFRGVLRDGGVISLPREPAWTASESIQYPMFLDAGRLGASTGLVVSYSDFGAGAAPAGRARLSGAPGRGAAGASSTRFEAYAPGRQRGPTWRSASAGWGAGVALADVSGDGVLDLIAGRWGPAPPPNAVGAPLEIYLGLGGGFTREPVWSSATMTVQETIALADLGREALRSATEAFRIEREQAVITLSRPVIEQIDEIRRNGAPVAPRDVAALPGGSWISFAQRLRPGDEVEVRYSYSTELDIVETNWDTSNTIYYYRTSSR
ncbi:FG-GAP repeat domain-containing protein [Sorangium sp. So ce861]|uniref:FG-GAP repeat domain-containing protein n=1 Tax=Sorangium sp. So ce861 TaxID=3133323 RepID=UPI003F5F40BD